MYEGTGVKALRKVTEKEYLDLAQNGARILFSLEGYMVLDGIKDNEVSHFVSDGSINGYHLIDLATCYELVTAFHCGGDRQFILENLEEIICSVK